MPLGGKRDQVANQKCGCSGEGGGRQCCSLGYHYCAAHLVFFILCTENFEFVSHLIFTHGHDAAHFLIFHHFHPCARCCSLFEFLSHHICNHGHDAAHLGIFNILPYVHDAAHLVIIIVLLTWFSLLRTENFE